MRLRPNRHGIVVLLCALTACDGLIPYDGEDDDLQDSGSSERRSSGNDASRGTESDAGATEDVPQDGGRTRRDAAASTTDAALEDGASSPDASGPLPGEPVATGGCSDTASWDPAWIAYEDEVLKLLNEARAAGHNCDTEGNFSGTTPLTMNANLRCAARLYSKNMADNDFFSHTGLDGSTMTTRIEAAGYKPKSTWGENIAAGQSTPADVMKSWLDSDGHCRNIMDPRFKEIGIGYFPKPNGKSTKPYWTQDFGG